MYYIELAEMKINWLYHPESNSGQVMIIKTIKSTHENV